MLSKIKSATLWGLNCYEVEIEIDISSGVPSFNIVGLAEQEIQESKERVRSALKNSGYDFPLKRITINLAPADLKKNSPLFDLPIAIGILSTSMKFNFNPEETAFFGELSFEGKIRKGRGLLSLVYELRNKGYKRFFIPKENEFECALIDGVEIYAVSHISEVVKFLTGEAEIKPLKYNFPNYKPTFSEDFSFIKGQAYAKRALEISAAGGHNVLLVGPPGTGKTLLARTFPSILPPLTYEEAFEVTQIYSAAGLLNNESLILERPFRSPHHTVSYAGLLGGGSTPQIGEVTLAHRGVLFLDELPEFRRDVLEALRQPLEEGKIVISRSKYTVVYPAQFILIAGMNPCKCGYFGDKEKECTCSPYEVKKYWSKVSGPLLDRMDIRVYVGRIEKDKIFSDTQEESSEEIRNRVLKAREVQKDRYKKERFWLNSQLTPKSIKKYCILSKETQGFLINAVDKKNLSMRAVDRLIKVARTIADLEESEYIKIEHLAEALSYRGLEDFISSL
ncbi:YifB family Mg chelatase-like AAA ATPase [Dictyoglomus thermophilum]|uniref:Mg chelatase n=1 Tax=Dictyoglomus thermophilum (strain ATCC 35947 / DSM 3960 / H-6-12) TaxID=309799 RepID=B5YFD0_DICT6|nr:YifB family Mg chelatase-like AAA ATPase [Dictyoglomus thermophilum]ACI18428.1 putative Mg chelatase [Dictyoglomus thermophilum H-6-12]MCX7719845.1 YifB family Mg chelatase-like AAA ATPase [Dictyoglomus thermophilum]